MNSSFDQINNSKVQNQYLEDNFLIEYDPNLAQNNKKCAIYFSSNNIYFPNTEENFVKAIIEENRFEWGKNKAEGVYKHIFIRDIFKQWYLRGINNKLNSIDKLADFLNRETKNFQTICIGSSAGGFAASLIGSIIKAEKVYTFNGQFEIASLLKTKKNRELNPLLVEFEFTPSINKYYNIGSYLKNSTTNIFYFNSIFSQWDKEQLDEVKKIENVHKICFKSSTHGIPFDLQDLTKTLRMKTTKLIAIAAKSPMTSLKYSICLNGLIPTLVNRITRKIKWILSI